MLLLSDGSIKAWSRLFLNSTYRKVCHSLCTNFFIFNAFYVKISNASTINSSNNIGAIFFTGFLSNILKTTTGDDTSDVCFVRFYISQEQYHQNINSTSSSTSILTSPFTSIAVSEKVARWAWLLSVKLLLQLLIDLMVSVWRTSCYISLKTRHWQRNFNGGELSWCSFDFVVTTGVHW